MLDSSRLDVLEKISASNFALSDAEDNTYRPLNREGIPDIPGWEHYWQFAKSPKNQISGKWWILLFY